MKAAEVKRETAEEEAKTFSLDYVFQERREGVMVLSYFIEFTP